MKPSNLGEDGETAQPLGVISAHAGSTSANVDDDDDDSDDDDGPGEPVEGDKDPEDEEEESSDSDRPPSPSPFKSKAQAKVLTPKKIHMRSSELYTRREDEESDRAPSPSPVKRPPLPSRLVGKPLLMSSRPVTATRPPAPPPADMSIISISSGSEEEMLPPVRLTKKAPPLQAVKARAVLTTKIQCQQKPPRRAYDPDDVIDLT